MKQQDELENSLIQWQHNLARFAQNWVWLATQGDPAPGLKIDSSILHSIKVKQKYSSWVLKMH